MRLTKKYGVACAIAAALGTSSIAHGNPQGYEVVEIGTPSNSYNSSPRALNDSGHVLGIAWNLLGLNIRGEFIDQQQFPTIEDFDNLTDRQYFAVRNYLQSGSGIVSSPRFQKLTRDLGYFYDGDFLSLNNLYDVVDPETGELTDSVNVRPLGMNNFGHLVGDVGLPYYRLEAENSAGDLVSYFTRDTFPQGFWTDGLTSLTLSSNEPELIQGGASRAYGVNDNGYVVGFASIDNRQALLNAYEVCTTSERENDDGEIEEIFLEPVPVCLWRAWWALDGGSEFRSPMFIERAYLWEIDPSGDVISQRELGTAIEPREPPEGEDELPVGDWDRSVARAVNSDGVAVGVSEEFASGFARRFATLFRDGEALRIVPEDESGATNSDAFAINDNGIVVGIARRSTSQTLRDRMFVADTNADDPSQFEVTFPRGFFGDSSWRPRAINNQNQVVGRAEPAAVQARRTTGFLYDINTDTITDLNTLVACDAGINIVDAHGINELGEIVVTAVRSAERVIDGDSESYNAVFTYLLRPSADAAVCPSDSSSVSRKGASMNLGFMGGLLAFVGAFAVITRRRRKALS
ncbi:MAG: DUF3466 family protein [Idiomarina sp.]|nr:DUF3466 family protein [Idiomarina sp.]